jgi:hypothetical protein
VQLGHRDVGLVDDDDEVLREVVEQREGPLPRLAPVKVARVVLDARAGAGLGEHLEVVLGARAQALDLEQLARGLELGEADLELGLDGRDGPGHRLVARDIVRRRVHRQVLERLANVAGERIEERDPLERVAEERESNCLLLVARLQLDGVATHPERATEEGHVVAVVVHVDEAAQQCALVVLLARDERHHLLGVLLG